MGFTESADTLLRARKLDALVDLCHENLDHPAAQRMLGKALFLQGRYHAAVVSLESHLRREPEDAVSWLRYVQALRRAGYPHADRAIEEALTHCPDDARLALERARRMAATGREAEALRCLPDTAPALFRLSLQRRLGHNDEAITDGVESLRNTYQKTLFLQLLDLMLEAGRLEDAQALTSDRNLGEAIHTAPIRDDETDRMDQEPVPPSAAIRSLFQTITELHLSVVDVGGRGGDLGPLATFAPVLDYIAFEPELGARTRLAQAAQLRAPWRSVTVLPDALGEMQTDATLFVTRKGGLSSTLRPDASIFAGVGMADRAEIVAQAPITLASLDQLVGEGKSSRPDILKLDVQGGELAVLKGANTALGRVGAIFLEAEFRPFYRGQPLFSDIDLYLRDRGFVLVDMDVSRLSDVGDGSEYARQRPVWTHALYTVNTDLAATDLRRGLSASTALAGFYQFAEAIAMLDVVRPGDQMLVEAIRDLRSAASTRLSLEELNSCKMMNLPALTVLWE